MARRAKFITFEGIEGCGKSTQIREIERAFSARSLKVFVTREPGGTPLGNSLRKILLEGNKDTITPLTELFLMEAARAEHVSTVLLPALKTNDLVLCDRFTDSTVAYQAGGRMIDRAFIERMNLEASQNLVPDVTVLLDLDVKTSLRRAIDRLNTTTSREDRFENETALFHERVRNSYLELSRREPTRFFVLNAGLPQEQITRSIVSRVDQLLSERE